MLRSKLKQTVAMTVAGLALLALAAPAADARKPATDPSQAPDADLVLPIMPIEPPFMCICLPPAN